MLNQFSNPNNNEKQFQKFVWHTKYSQKKLTYSYHTCTYIFMTILLHMPKRLNFGKLTKESWHILFTISFLFPFDFVDANEKYLPQIFYIWLFNDIKRANLSHSIRLVRYHLHQIITKHQAQIPCTSEYYNKNSIFM